MSRPSVRNGGGAPPIGNTNSKAQNRYVGATLRRIAHQHPEKLRRACEAIFEAAANGDVAAFREIADRLDGKASAGNDSGGIKVLILRENSHQITPIDIPQEALPPVDTD